MTKEEQDKITHEIIGYAMGMYNPYFNYTEFGTINNLAESNNFVLSVKQLVEKTSAIEITARAGRHCGLDPQSLTERRKSA